MNDFTKAIYEDLGMDTNKPFNEQIGNRNKKVFLKFDKLLKSKEYEIISNKLPINDAKGFIHYHYEYFEKFEDYYGVKAKNSFDTETNHNKSKKGQPEILDNEIKLLQSAKDLLVKYELNEIHLKYKKFQGLGFLDEIIADLQGDCKIVTNHRDFKRKTTNKKITDELKSLNLFTKREIENFSSRLTTIQNS